MRAPLASPIPSVKRSPGPLEQRYQQRRRLSLDELDEFVCKRIKHQKPFVKTAKRQFDASSIPKNLQPERFGVPRNPGAIELATQIDLTYRYAHLVFDYAVSVGINPAFPHAIRTFTTSCRSGAMFLRGASGGRSGIRPKRFRPRISGDFLHPAVEKNLREVPVRRPTVVDD
jgi:hypothetical protein